MHTIQPIMLDGIAKDQCRDTLFNHTGPPSIFNFIDLSVAATLQAKISSRNRAPSQTSYAGKVKNVMESVAVVVIRIVRECLPHLLAVPRSSNPRDVRFNDFF